MDIPYFSKALLIEANNDAILEHRNRQLDPEHLVSLDDDTLFPVIWSMLHNETEVRCKLLLSPEDEAWLDVSRETFSSLPHSTLPTH